MIGKSGHIVPFKTPKRSPCSISSTDAASTGAPWSPASSVPASSRDLRMVEESLLREMRTVKAQVQSVCAEEIRNQHRHLMQDIKQELRMQANKVPPWGPLPPLVPGLQGPPGAPMTLPKGNAFVRNNSEIFELKGPLETKEALDIECVEVCGKGTAEHSQSKRGRARSDDAEKLELPGTVTVELPPQMPCEVPVPPTDPPEVECNADAAAGSLRQRARHVDVPQRVNTFLSQASDDEGSEVEYPRRFLRGNTTTGIRRLSLGLQTARRSRDNSAKNRKPLCQMSAKDILKSSRFDNMMGCLILLNAVTIGMQTDYSCRNMTEDYPMPFKVISKLFFFVFLLELVLRIHVQRLRFFTTWDRSLLWNYFDLMVVVAQAIEEILTLVASNSDRKELGSFRLLRVLRVLRLVRIFRVIRVLHLISELRTIVNSIVGSFKSLGWTVVLLFLIIYIFGVYFTQSITDHMVTKLEFGEELDEQEMTLRRYFANLFRAILSLWQAMSGGADWDTMAGPMLRIDWSLGVAFASYIAFALLALMNVVTGVFVQTALQNAKDEEDAFLTDQIIRLFERADRDKQQTVTLAEINNRLGDPNSAREWKSINVQPEEAQYLFELLDIDETGEIAFEEFLSGCLRLHGVSKSMDLLTVMQEARAESRAWRKHLEKWDGFHENNAAFMAGVMRHLQAISHYVLAANALGGQNGDHITTAAKDSLARVDQRLKLVEGTFDVVKRMAASWDGMQSIIEAIAVPGAPQGHQDRTPWFSRGSEV